MNIIQSGSSVSPSRRLQAWHLAFACAAALVVSAAVGVNLDRGAGAGAASPEPPGFSVPNSAEPAITVIYQAAESEGLVPDESQVGFSSPANLREHLKAERGEFSNALH